MLKLSLGDTRATVCANTCNIREKARSWERRQLSGAFSGAPRMSIVRFRPPACIRCHAQKRIPENSAFVQAEPTMHYTASCVDVDVGGGGITIYSVQH